MRVRQLAVVLVVVLGLLLFAGLGCGAEETATDETTEDTAASTDTSAGGTSETSEPGEEAAAPSGDPIVFGAVVSATGPAAPLGEPERATLQMLEEQINDRGGILGRPVEIVIEDDQSNPNEAVTATNKLIQQDGAIAIIGGTISPSTLAMKPITAREGIPHVTMSAANAITDEPPIEWIWRTPPKDALAVARALTHVSEELGVTRIAVLHDENAFGSSGLSEIEESAGDYGLEVVAKESYKTDETDLTAPLTKIRSSEPEALVVWGTNPGPAVAAKNMDQLGMDIPYVGSHGIANTTFIELAGESAEGVVFPAGKLLIPESITDPAQKEVVDDFIAAYEEATGNRPNTFAGHAFDSVGLLADAIERAGSTDAGDIQTALNATSGWAGPDGIYNYSETDHDGLAVEDLIMVRIEDGSWVLAE